MGKLASKLTDQNSRGCTVKHICDGLRWRERVEGAERELGES